MHFARSPVVVASARSVSSGATAAAVAAASITAGLASGPAFRAAAGSVGETAGGVKLLLADCESKFSTTITAGKGLFGVHNYILSMHARIALKCGRLETAANFRTIPQPTTTTGRKSRRGNSTGAYFTHVPSIAAQRLTVYHHDKLAYSLCRSA